MFHICYERYIFQIVSLFLNTIGNDKRSSPGYDDDYYDNDPFAPTKVPLVTFSVGYVYVNFSSVDGHDANYHKMLFTGKKKKKKEKGGGG